MTDLDLVGPDLAKNVLQLHGCSSTGEVVFANSSNATNCLRSFLSCQPAPLRLRLVQGATTRVENLRHSVRVIAPKYVKPFVKRSKSDPIDAVAICEAALRPTMYYPGRRCKASLRAICAGPERR